MSITQSQYFFFQCLIDMGWYHAGHISAQGGDFLDGTRGKEGMLLRGDERDRFNIAGETLICKAHAELKAALPDCRIIWDAASNLPNRRRS